MSKKEKKNSHCNALQLNAAAQRALSGRTRVQEYPEPNSASCIQQLPLSRALAAMAVGLAEDGCTIAPWSRVRACAGVG